MDSLPSLSRRLDLPILSTMKKGRLSGLLAAGVLVALLALCCLPAAAQVQLVPTANYVSFPTTAIGSSSAVQNVLVETTADEIITSIIVPVSQGGNQEFFVGAMSGCTLEVTVPSGTICTVPITFTPAYPGQRWLPLQVVTSSGNVSFGLVGVGTGPQAALAPGIITNAAGNGGQGYTADNVQATTSEMNFPEGVAVDFAGNIYIADTYNQRIRKVDTSGNITTITGTGIAGFFGDNGLAINAEVNYPTSVAVDAVGNLFIADEQNNRIRKIDTNGIITTVAGGGSSCDWWTVDNCLATSVEIILPQGVAVDSAGNFYFTDEFDNVVHRVGTDGIISTAAGGGSDYLGDNGPAINAILNFPSGLAVDASGNLYIADKSDNRIRKVDTDGIITTVAGTGGSGYSGDNSAATAAELNKPYALSVDAAGNLYIADTDNNRIRKVDGNGIITTVAGNGAEWGTPANDAANNVSLWTPYGVAIDSSGNLYIADTNNDFIRKVSVGQSALNYATATGVGQTDFTDGAQTVSVYNTGNASIFFGVPVSGSNPNISSGFVYDAASTCPLLIPYGTPTQLAAGTDCTYAIDFIPTASGNNSGQLTLIDSSLGWPFITQTVALTGTGVVLPATTTNLTTNLTSVQPGQAVTLVATVSGSGTAPTGIVVFSALSTGANQGVLGTVSLTNGAATYYGLVPVGTDTITATYSGDTNNAGSTSNAVTVFNASVNGKLQFNWDGLNWAQGTGYGGCTSPWPVTLTNLTGVAVATPTLSLSNPNFQILNSTCTGGLVQGQSCTFSVEFCPTTGGSLNGSAVSATLTASTTTSASYSATIPVSGTALSSSLTFNWPALNFTPSVAVGAVSSPWPVTITNQSGTATTMNSPVVTFTDASFAIASGSDTCSGITVAAGGSCLFSVTFSPIAADVTQAGTNIISGTMTAKGNGGAITGSLGVGGWASAGLVFNWPSVNFPAQIVGTTGNNPWPVMVTNLTGQNLTGITYNVTAGTNYLNGAFTLNNTCSSLSAGASCTFNVVPSPVSPMPAGAYSATLVVTGTTASSQSYSSTTLGMSGSVIQGGYTINWNQNQQGGVSTIDFGPQNTGGITSGPWPITVYNNTAGSQVLSFSPSLSVFTVAQSTCNGVPSGGSCTFNLYYTPTNVETDRGTLIISGGGYSYTFNIWGQASTANYPVSGQISLTNSCGASASGVTVSINTNPVQTTTTDSNGNFSFASVPNGNYTITPSITGPTAVFYPATQSITVNGGGQSASFAAALGYTVSGTVSYGGSKTGNIYLTLSGNSCGNIVPGTTLSSAGAFTLRGVLPGNYTLKAWMDTLGYGAKNATDPSGSTSSVTVSTANLTGVAVTLSNAGGVTLGTAPSLEGVSAMDSGAVVEYAPLTNTNGVETARSYTLQWSTDPAFGSVTGSESFAATGTNGTSVWILNGLTDTAQLYFRVNGVAGGSTSSWSSVYGPVTIGAPTAANTISGTVSFAATATGPLYVGFLDSSTGSLYATTILNPVSPQAYSVEVPNGSNYTFFGILDQNKDGIIDAGDVTNTNGNDTLTTINGSSSSMNLVLPSANSTATLKTQHVQQNGASDFYNLSIDVRAGIKLPVAVVLVSGPNTVTPADIGQCTSCGSDPFSFSLSLASDRPSVGDTYGLQVTYSDGSSETLTPSVGAVLDAFATNLAPTTGVSTSTSPAFTWTDPANASNYTYQFSLSDSSGNQIWQIPASNSKSNGFSSSITSIQYGTDPLGGSNTPTLSSLSTSTNYSWLIQVEDSNGNTAQEQVNYQP